jgi:hypothetical protein
MLSRWFPDWSPEFLHLCMCIRLLFPCVEFLVLRCFVLDKELQNQGGYPQFASAPGSVAVTPPHTPSLITFVIPYTRGYIHNQKYPGDNVSYSTHTGIVLYDITDIIPYRGYVCMIYQTYSSVSEKTFLYLNNI